MFVELCGMCPLNKFLIWMIFVDVISYMNVNMYDQLDRIYFNAVQLVNVVLLFFFFFLFGKLRH